MDITIVRDQKNKVPLLDDEGTHVALKGVPQFVIETTTEEIPFETHPCELASSAAQRLATKLGETPKSAGLRPMLAHKGDASPLHPDKPLGVKNQDGKFVLTWR